MHPLIWFGLSLVGVIVSAELLVKNVLSFAKKTGITTLFLGSFILALGTTFPELMNNLFSALLKASPFGAGDAVGSFIANLCLIFAITLFFYDFKMNAKLKRYTFFMFVSTLLLLGLSLDGILSRLDGIILIMVFVMYQIVAARFEKGDHISSIPKKELVLAFFITFLLVVSSWSLVNSALAVASMFHASLASLGALVVAFATSLPELITMISSLTKKEIELSRGNLLGANVMNLTLIIGVSALIRPIVISSFLEYAMVYSVLAATVFVYLSFKGKASKALGTALLIFYVIFLMTGTILG